MMGPGYIADSLQAAAEKRARLESWHCYAGDVLRLLATAWGAENVTRYRDILHPKPEDTRTAEEIAEDFVRRMGLKRKTREQGTGNREQGTGIAKDRCVPLSS